MSVNPNQQPPQHAGKVVLAAWLLVLAAASYGAGAPGLLAALRAGEKAAVKALLAHGADPNTKDDNGTPAIMTSVLYDDAECLEFLLDAGADPNARNSAGATALLWAAGDPRKAGMLIAHGADVNVRSKLGRTPLLVAAAQEGASPVVEKLLAHEASLDVRDELKGMPAIPIGTGGAPPVVEAAKARDGKTLRLLLATGVDPNAEGNNGVTALTEAIVLGNQDNVRQLLGAGARIKTDAPQFAPLIFAALKNDSALARILIDAGVDVNGRDGMGSTALMWAAYSEKGGTELVRMLLAAGADPSVKNQNGETALTWASWHGQTAVVHLLKSLKHAE